MQKSEVAAGDAGDGSLGVGNFPVNLNLASSDGLMNRHSLRLQKTAIWARTGLAAAQRAGHPGEWVCSAETAHCCRSSLSRAAHGAFSEPDVRVSRSETYPARKLGAAAENSMSHSCGGQIINADAITLPIA
jgi:hypothetical protein